MFAMIDFYLIKLPREHGKPAIKLLEFFKRNRTKAVFVRHKNNIVLEACHIFKGVSYSIAIPEVGSECFSARYSALLAVGKDMVASASDP
jgi:hypothetical protein